MSPANREELLLVALGLAKVDQGPLDFNRITGIITDFKNSIYKTGTIQ